MEYTVEQQKRINEAVAFDTKPLEIGYSVNKDGLRYKSVYLVNAQKIAGLPAWAKWVYLVFPTPGNPSIVKIYKTKAELQNDASIFYETYMDNVDEGIYPKGFISYEPFGPATVDGRRIGEFIERQYKEDIFSETRNPNNKNRYNVRITVKEKENMPLWEEKLCQELIQHLNKDGFVKEYNKEYHYHFYELKNVPKKMVDWWWGYVHSNFHDGLTSGSMVRIHYCRSEWCRSHDYRDKFINLQVEPKPGFYRCAYCGKLTPKSQIEVDHIIPVEALMYNKNNARNFAYENGITSTNDIKNLALACHNCNEKKGSEFDMKWIKKQECLIIRFTMICQKTLTSNGDLKLELRKR